MGMHRNRFQTHIQQVYLNIFPAGLHLDGWLYNCQVNPGPQTMPFPISLHHLLTSEQPESLYPVFLDDSDIAFHSQTNQINEFLLFPYIFFYDHILVKSIFSTINIHFLTCSFVKSMHLVYANKFI